jgi:hypothetical protein
MDTFPSLVIYTSLLALSRRPDAWRALHNGENLLLSADDFTRVDATAAWRLLDSIEDPEVAHVVARLRWCCPPAGTPTGRWRHSSGPSGSSAASRKWHPDRRCSGCLRAAWREEW